MSTSDIYSLRIELLRLPKQARVCVDFFPDGEDAPTWTLGLPRFVHGLQVVGAIGPGVSLQRLTISPRRVELTPNADIASLLLNLHLRCNTAVIGGHLDVSGDAAARFSTPFDEVTILGNSSWYCRMF